MKTLPYVFSTVLVMWSALVLPARAQFFPIPELVGPAPEYGSGITVNFDLGQEFKEVREVILLIEATTTPLTVMSCGTIAQPEPCEVRRIPVGFYARLDDPDAGFLSAVVDGFRSDRPVRKSGVFNQVFVDFDLDSLRDGKGELTLFWNQIYFLTGTAPLRDSLPSGEILDAVLIIDGTPIKHRKNMKGRNYRRWKRSRH